MFVSDVYYLCLSVHGQIEITKKANLVNQALILRVVFMDLRL